MSGGVMGESQPNPESGSRVYGLPAGTVVIAVACTWCGAGLGEDCREPHRWKPEPVTLAMPHAQRWRDYWNATHDRRERIPVYPAPWVTRVFPSAVTPPKVTT